jgi:hypothetical protein
MDPSYSQPFLGSNKDKVVKFFDKTSLGGRAKTIGGKGFKRGYFLISEVLLRVIGGCYWNHFSLNDHENSGSGLICPAKPTGSQPLTLLFAMASCPFGR